MGLRRRVTAAAAVFLMGGLASMPFYRPAGQPAVVHDNRTLIADSKPHVTVALQIPSSELDDPREPPAGAGETTDRTLEQATIRHSPAERDPAEPPRLASEFPRGSQRLPPASMARADDKPRASLPADPVEATPVQPADDDEQDGDTPDMHRIRDGDTLQRIARKYLKNADRWPEILAENRDLIKDPEVLPVGTEIRIPNGRKRSEPIDAMKAVAEPAPSFQGQPLTPLVPIP